MILPGCWIIICVLLVYLTENEYICNTITRAVITLITNHRRPTGQNTYNDDIKRESKLDSTENGFAECGQK